MAIQPNAYYYNTQLKRHVLQFMAVFTGLQVQVGKSATQDERLIRVPIHYAHRDRVVASIIAGNTQNKPIRLPIMSAYLTDLNIDTDRMKGTGNERRVAYTPVGGLVPDDTRVVYQRQPVPITLSFDLNLYSSNTDQEFQILEQILPLFNPFLTIQTSDAPLDWTRLTQVVLTNISNGNNYPSGTDRRILQKTLSFTVPVWIDIPADIRKNLVEQIYLRIGAVSAGAVSSEDIIADLDGQGIEYELWQDASELNF